MSPGIIVNDRVSNWHRTGLVGLIGLYLVIGALRLNDCDFLNPDSPRYLIYAQSIANTGDYRAIDLPGSPIYSWRPPGLSMLLAPVMAVRPYDVVAAKSLILLAGALLLVLVFRLASLHCSAWSALGVTGVIASGPTFLVLSTEVLSEIPYALAVMIVLTILNRWAVGKIAPDGDVSCGFPLIPLMIAILVLAFTPWLRTAGVSLVAAVGIWCLMSRARWMWLLTALAGVTGLGGLAWRNKLASGENYVGSLLTRFREHGVVPVFQSGCETFWHYVGTVPGLILPGLANERPWYAPITVDPLATLALPQVVPAIIAAVLVSFGLMGMWNRRRVGGSLALLYVILYTGCLVLWPWRHERFLWPLLPAVIAFVPAGFSVVNSSRIAVQPGLSICGGLGAIVLISWQTICCGQLVQVNHEFVRDPVRFFATRYPGFYFSNWRRAGEWLNVHSPQHARILTWHAAVGETAHRFQKRVQFETLSPEKLRQQMEAFSARYLVVSDAQFGDGFGWQQVAADPTMRFEIVYREQGVAILEATPNRTGEVSKNAYPELLATTLLQSELARKQWPQRSDLAIRHASLLREMGRDDEANGILKGLIANGVKTVRVCADLGWMLFDAGNYAEATTFLEMARTLPNAESIAGMLADGVKQAQYRMRQKPSERDAVQAQMNRVKSLMGSLKFAAAEREAEKLLLLAPDSGDVAFVRGKLYHRVGELAQAVAWYEKATKRGNVECEKWLRLIRLSESLSQATISVRTSNSSDQGIDHADSTAYIHVAALQSECGWGGRSLATLELANERFVDKSSIQKPLADLYLVFARPELALPLYQSILEREPENEDAKRGIQVAQEGLRVPAMDAKSW